MFDRAHILLEIVHVFATVVSPQSVLALANLLNDRQAGMTAIGQILGEAFLRIHPCL